VSVGKRAAFKSAIRMAAAMVNDADFCSLFGDEIIAENETDEEILQEAQGKAVARILAIIGEKP